MTIRVKAPIQHSTLPNLPEHLIFKRIVRRWNGFFRYYMFAERFLGAFGKIRELIMINYSLEANSWILLDQSPGRIGLVVWKKLPTISEFSDSVKVLGNVAIALCIGGVGSVDVRDLFDVRRSIHRLCIGSTVASHYSSECWIAIRNHINQCVLVEI